MENKLAVYLCSGCGIGEALSMDRLLNIAATQYHADIYQIHPCLCSVEGRMLIDEGLAGGAHTVVIGACSPRVKQECFNFDHPVVQERVNLREQVAWSHPAGDPDTQAMAEDHLRMGLARAVKISRATPFLSQVNKTILVIGGGITGMSAALGGAEAGYEVCLVEKSPSLGGWMNKLYRQYPKRPPYKEPEETGTAGVVGSVENHAMIRVCKSTEVERIEGSPGMFDVSLKGPGGTEQIKAGAIIVATGFQPYNAARLGYLGFGSHPDIITNLQMEQLAFDGVIKRPSDGKVVQSAVFIQCAGQRNSEHLPYCSSFCCMTSLKQALYLTGNNADAKAYILYKDIRTPSLYEDFYRNVQEAGSIFLSKTETPEVTTTANGITVEAQDLLLGERVKLNVDLVILATGMVPSTPPVLNLSYRQGKELPELKYGFPDSHFICFPYETRRTGIYAAGLCQAAYG